VCTACINKREQPGLVCAVPQQLLVEGNAAQGAPHLDSLRHLAASTGQNCRVRTRHNTELGGREPLLVQGDVAQGGPHVDGLRHQTRAVSTTS
jgi:hypothetical protein